MKVLRVTLTVIATLVLSSSALNLDSNSFEDLFKADYAKREPGVPLTHSN